MSYTETNDLTIDAQEIKLKKTRWSKEEISSVLKGIAQNKSIEDFANDLNRTIQAVCSKGNLLGHGYFTNKIDGLMYFKETINHKNRRTNDEILEGTAKVPIESAKAVEDCDKKSTVIIPKKRTIEISLGDIDLIIKILTKERMDLHE